MHQYQFTQIGQFHTNHNEDYLISNPIGSDKMMIAVMDGCSMGTESYFAATLIGKLLRKISREIHYKEFAEKTNKTLDQIQKEVLRSLFKSLKFLKNKLNLERDELLSTMILGIVDEDKNEVEIMTIGDGVVFCNGVMTEYEQDNQPDYIGYHLNENFEDWYKQQNQRLYLSNIIDLSIATDGVFTFKKFDNNIYPILEESEILIDLFVDKQEQRNENMLLKKMIRLEQEWGLKPSDDLTVIRLIM